jgi:hypothetical protein
MLNKTSQDYSVISEMTLHFTTSGYSICLPGFFLGLPPTIKMETVCSSEMLEHFYWITATLYTRALLASAFAWPTL